ncbi:uncharacterized protein LOC107636786 [Arachis ipaensis]|uniref:uncharacterized protein LOC107636786 n=1 Tax=Arachis ipaensis TaxID=130454 RepID=UPI0007AF35FC|nr:uncharacterized protein LOC107636786 [Arachis ipaensis]
MAVSQSLLEGIILIFGKRISAHNILVVQEVVHTVRNKNQGKGIMAIKIDLEKAYNRQLLSQELGMTLKTNLEKYLGVSLITQKWRCTLIQSVLSTIPSYYMQTMKIPIAVYVKIDKLCRDFLWGNSEDDEKVHFLSWEKICKPKEEGGLWIQKAQETNQLFLMKLA